MSSVVFVIPRAAPILKSFAYHLTITLIFTAIQYFVHSFTGYLSLGKLRNFTSVKHENH